LRKISCHFIDDSRQSARSLPHSEVSEILHEQVPLGSRRRADS
jgi:hypothetical protein